MRLASRFSFLAALVLTLSACDGGGSFEVADVDGAGGAGGQPFGDAGDEGEAGGSDPDGAADGGADSDAEASDPCAPPEEPSKAALCLVIEPEAIDFLAEDERFDGKGVLQVDVFDTSLPGVSEAPLVAVKLPEPPTKLAGLAELVAKPIRFELAPGIVHPRVLFVDDMAAVSATPGPGVWLGGYDVLKTGIKEALPLLPVALEAGKAHEVRIHLVALRQLKVTVSRGGANPRGDAQGPLWLGAFDSADLSKSVKTFGLGSKECADLKAGPAIADGAIVGKGPYWAVAVLDDFGVGGTQPAGAMVSLPTQLNYLPGAYRVEASLTMATTLANGSGDDNVRCD